MASEYPPNQLESAFAQRDASNSFYEQINISGSDLIIYHSSSGELTADKISVWVDKYGINDGGLALSSSYASSSGWSLAADYALLAGEAIHATTSSYTLTSSISVSSSYAGTASIALNIGYAQSLMLMGG